MEHRRYQRITYTAPAVVQYHDLSYDGKLVNISLNGAMVCANEGMMISQGESCTVLIIPEGEREPIRFEAVVAHAFFSMVGVQFVFDAEQQTRLFELLEGLSKNPEELRLEWKFLLGQGHELSTG